MEQTHEPQGGTHETGTGQRAEREPRRHPQIYVASLSDYNAGILHGDWIFADNEPEVLQEAIGQMLDRSPTTEATGEVAEEWAIHDFDGFGQAALGEYESLERVAQLARGIVRYGEPFSAWWADEDRSDEDGGDVFTQFEQQFQGEYSTFEEYGESLLEELGVDIDDLAEVPESLRPYVCFDLDAWLRDLRIGGDITVIEGLGRVYVFWPE